MSRSLLGAGLGATGATLYLQPEILQNWARDIVFGPSTRPTGPGGKELEQLQRLVEDLSRQVAAGQKGGVTVVHTGTSTTGSYVLYGAAAAGLGVVVYFRVLKGWTFGDMLYATRRGLKEGLAQVSTGLEQLGARVADVKARLQERIAQLMKRQEEMLGAQAEMKASLAGVGRDVEHTRGQVGQIHSVVMDLEASMAEVGANQRHANHGIYVLCKAVSELMAGSAIPSKAELIEYTQQHPVWAAASEQRLQGLESLLGSHTTTTVGMRRSASARRADEATATAAPERRGPFLLGPLPGSAASSPPQRRALAEAVAAGAVGGTSGSSTSGMYGGVAATQPDSVTFPPPVPARHVSVGGGGSGSSASGFDMWS
ncbi:NADH-cytochrome b5 reductase 1 [Chlorella sorokiniana]|uniref:NADH-cytochrome b5 reductase 1 n=1 Tax=Chlorella sorokiniana TaxID=3076 RepID=A0A2P6TBH7_CHLSO|nr:NADH-cytochrome b5 reductase 1 [Chlorella sorokiniana]|eukprot:PRW05903.1 NADH-cytochrome b5 reductase 1 [Chlorella sorokiniana]